jgi:hypothetical protein
MRKYRATAATPARLDYGIELVAGLKLFPETAGLAPAFETLNNELDVAHENRRAKRKPLVMARVSVRFANYMVDQTIRSAGKAAEIADGGRRAIIFKAAFPEGVGRVVAPAGKRQIAPTEQLIERITKSKAAGMDAYRAEWLPKLDAALKSLKTAAEAYTAAYTAYVSEFATELALRQAHFVAVDQLMGQVRAAFPGDKAKQDLAFPVMEDEEESVELGANGGGAPAGVAVSSVAAPKELGEARPS